ncbi:MAG TPA: type II toxin-antitoxin system death-on-curing family toxin, partial [Burkholderiaceae bacterium]|nr:type II toxin-antitoxin system death-on-curing family toxin [Burkholderiaceae bacterium]
EQALALEPALSCVAALHSPSTGIVDSHALMLALQGDMENAGGVLALESALVRPLNIALYESPDVARLAASYGVGLAKNHPFTDGNKRAAFLAVGLFLARNGYRLDASQVEATLTMLGVAGGSISEAEFAVWLRSHIRPR